MRQIISYQRPETGDTLARISVSGEAETLRQVRRLRALGYTIVDVAPIASGREAVRRGPQLATAR